MDAKAKWISWTVVGATLGGILLGAVGKLVENFLGKGEVPWFLSWTIPLSNAVLWFTTIF